MSLKRMSTLPAVVNQMNALHTQWGERLKSAQPTIRVRPSPPHGKRKTYKTRVQP